LRSARIKYFAKFLLFLKAVRAVSSKALERCASCRMMSQYVLHQVLSRVSNRSRVRTHHSCSRGLTRTISPYSPSEVLDWVVTSVGGLKV